MVEDNYFNIHSYLDKNQRKIEGEFSFCDGAIMSLNEDNAGEPYISISYVNGSYEEGGLHNLENMDKLYLNALPYRSIFPVFPFNAIISVLYNKNNKKIEFANLSDRSCLECDVIYNDKSTVCVGYVINKNSNLDYDSKIKLLYEVMKISMVRAYGPGKQKNINFKINNQIVSNTFCRDSKLLEELSNQVNLAVIKSEFNVDLDKPYQKTK